MPKWALPTIYVLITILAIAAIWISGYITGQMVSDPTKAVCHAITEDSHISDCDYRNGAWYRK